MVENSSETTSRASTSSRLIPIDALRGLIIILMTLDHANYFIAQRHPPGELWGGLYPSYDSAIAFLTRFITHLSAPGFFFLMGAGMILFSSRRLTSSWSWNKIRRHLVLRGLILIMLQFVVVNPIWKISPIPFPDWYQGVLVALGGTMILATLLLRLKARGLFMITAVVSVIIEITHPDPRLWGAFNDTPLGLIFGFSGGTQAFWVNYPILAWFEFVTFGMAFGHWFRDKPESAYRRASIIGFCLLIAFVPIRAINGFGNIRPMEGTTWIDFMNLVKYPPSWTFSFITVGLDLMMLSGLHFGRQRLSRFINVLSTYGRVPLFLYITHLLLFALSGRIFTPLGSTFFVMYIFWFVGIALLYYPAKWYAHQKKSPRARILLQYL